MTKLHRLWLGPRPLPDAFRFYGKEWARLNPSHELVDWGWTNLPTDLHNSEVMEDLRKRCTSGTSVELPTALADVIAYELVWRYGGIYVNTDIQPIRPLSLIEPVIRGQAWCAMEDETWPVNAVIGGPRYHPFWRAVMDELPKRYWRMRDESPYMNQLTGPWLLRAVRDARPGELVCLPSEMFCPLHFTEIPLGGNADGLWSLESLPKNTVAVHSWHHRFTGRTNKVS